MRETIEEKVARLLVGGRVTLRVLSDAAIVAVVRGDSARLYRTGWSADGWWCSCPSGAAQRPARCSHVRAIQRVVLEPIGPDPVGDRP